MNNYPGLNNRPQINAGQTDRNAKHGASIRICMIAYTHYSYDPRVRRAAEAFASRGDIVDFLSLSEGSSKEETINSVRITPLRAAKYQGSDIRKYIFGYIRFLALASWTLTRRHLKNRYDVIYIHTMPDFMVLASLPAKFLGAKVVLDVHDTMPELWQSKFGVPERHILVRLAKLQERVSCWFADQVVAVHEPHRRLLQARGVAGSKTTVVMNVPDPSIFGSARSHRSEYTKAGPPRLVYHGTITERLGLDLAIRAFKEVLKEVPTARFELYGTGNFAQTIVGLIESLGIQNSVYFPNRSFPVEEIPKLLKAATIGIIPNRSDAATRYMLPVKLLEYAHLGIPAVAPKLEVIQHYFKDDSVGYFIPGNVGSLCSVICSLLADPDRRSTLGLNAQRVCEEYSWESMKSCLFETVDRLGAAAT